MRTVSIVVALVVLVGCDSKSRDAPTSVPSTPTAHGSEASDEPGAPAPSLRLTGQVARELGPVIDGAPTPRRIFCDPALERAQRAGRRDRIIVDSRSYSQLVDVENGPIGEPFSHARFSRRGTSDWMSVDRGIMSLEDGSFADLEALVQYATGDERRGWALRRHAVITTTDAEHREIGKRVESSRYWVVEDGRTKTFPFDKGLRPSEPIVRGDSIWARVSSDGCMLMRFDTAGKVSCGLESIDDWRPENMYALGDRWLIVWRSRGGGARIVDTETRSVLDFPQCADAEIAEFVPDPPAVSMMCKDSKKVGYWTPTTGLRLVADLPGGWRMYPDPMPRYARLHNVVTEDGRVLGQRYFDAVRGVLTDSQFDLSRATRAGFLYDDGEAVDANSGETHSVDLPPCEDDWEVRDSYGHYALIVCQERAKRPSEARSRPRKLTSCREPRRPPDRLAHVVLVDLKSGASHQLRDAKPVVLSEDGLVVIRGSGHDLDFADGTEVVFQPYPASRSEKEVGTTPDTAQPARTGCPAVGERYRSVEATGMALLGGRTHARVHFKSDTIVNYADEDWVTSKKWKCSDGRLVVSGAKTRMKGNRIVWDGVTFEKVSK